MNSILSVQNKSSHKTEKSLLKFLQPSQAPKVVCTDNSMEFGKHVRFYHGITALQHLIDPRQMASPKEPSDEWRKVRQQHCHSQAWMKDGAPGIREHAVRKTIWRTMQRTNNSFWSNGSISSVFTERSVENSSIWQESTTWNLSWPWPARGEDFGKEIPW